MVRTLIILVIISIGLLVLGACNTEKRQANCLNWKMVEKGSLTIEQL